MKVATAKVIDGRIEAPPEFAEGSPVAILASDDPEPVALLPEQEQELSDALDAIRSGEHVDGWALLEDLKTKRPA
jgi:hypothetical protein